MCPVLCLVAQSCPTLCDPMDCSPPGSSVHGDSPGKNPGVGCYALLQGCSQLRDRTQVSWIAGGFLTSWATREAHAQKQISPCATATEPECSWAHVPQLENPRITTKQLHIMLQRSCMILHTALRPNTAKQMSNFFFKEKAVIRTSNCTWNKK